MTRNTMDISRFTPAQQESICYDGDHLFIKAGAGTGKTATLTAKVAYLLEKQNAIAFEHVSELLAITFTDKAAGELVGRIRGTLRKEGCLDEALLVDGAWVSTIHGMCSRILRDNAFALGVDPTFSVISKEHASELRAQAILEVVQGEGGIRDSGEYDDLFDEYELEDYGRSGGGFSVASILDKLVDNIATLPEGASDIHTGPQPATPAAILSAFALRCRQNLAMLQDGSDLSDQGQKCVVMDEEALSMLEGWDREDEAEAERLLIDMFDGIELASYSGKKSEILEMMDAQRRPFQEAYEEYCQYRAYPLLVKFLGLATTVGEHYGALKREEGGLDNSDLLIMVYHALEEHPDIARRYADTFKLIMIDEFQDTDLLQIRIARALSPEGQGLLVTVGDEQQSIYRFRGADVNLFRRFESELPDGSLKRNLDTNFRSHGDILAFVNKVFGAPDMFGDTYLHLNVQENRENPPYPDGHPRIDMILTTSTYSGNANTAERVRHEAAAIARRFQTFRESGYRSSQMVLLLGGMTNAQVYADALRAAGFEVIITGGSVFWQQPEPVLIGYLLRLLANPRDNEAAYEVLSSPLVELSPSELALLAFDENGRERKLCDGLMAITGIAPARVVFAHRLLIDALARVDVERPSNLVLRVLVESGYTARLDQQGATGMATCANLLKALRNVTELEEEGQVGFAQVARSYTELAAGLPKDAPGALKAEDQEAVSIMTIHASKGLEFPIVALAEFDQPHREDDRFILESAAGAVAVSLVPGEFRKQHDYDTKRLLPDSPVTISDLTAPRISRGEYHRRLGAYKAQETAAEMQRRFYVGATRAEEALILAFHPYFKKGGVVAQTPILDAIAALFPDGLLPLDDADVDYGGSEPAHYECILLEKDDAGNIIRRGHDEYEIPELVAVDIAAELPVLGDFEKPLYAFDVDKTGPVEISYSSIAPEHGTVGADEATETARADEAAETAESRTGGAAAARGEDETASDEGEATQLGLAFHSIAEYLVLSSAFRDGKVQPPTPERVEIIASNYELTDAQHARLLAAVSNWCKSDVAKRAATYATLRAEVPFYQLFVEGDDEALGETAASVPTGGSHVYLDGEIDLLCLDGKGTQAFIVDYKTGGSPDETPEQLRDKHRLQALCYAEAVFAAGIEKVEFAFTRVEQVDGAGQLQVVPYAFDALQAQAIHDEIEGIRTKRD